MTSTAAKRYTALLALGFSYVIARDPDLGDSHRAAYANAFAFARTELPASSRPGNRTVRAVNPSLRHIDAWISSVGAGVALGDVDGDGISNDACHVDPRTDDVIVSEIRVPSDGLRFAQFEVAQTTVNRATQAPMGCLITDVNADGAADFVVYYWGRTPVAYLRDAALAASAAAYVPHELIPGSARWFSNAGLVADVDGDGHLDLVIGNYFADGAEILDSLSRNAQTMQESMSRAANGGTKRVLLWAGNEDRSGRGPGVPKYRDATEAFDSGDARSWTLAIGSADLNGDLLPELYFANDFGPDQLMLNVSKPGHVRFVKLRGVRGFLTPASKLLGHDSFKGMGVDFGELLNRGQLDIVVSNIAAPYALEESHFAFVNTGDSAAFGRGEAPFVDRSEELGLARSDWAWDLRLADFDNDGQGEVIQATGFVRGTNNRWPELQELAMGNDDLLSRAGVWPRFSAGDDVSGHTRNPFLVRAEPGHFADVGTHVWPREPGASRGLAVGDVDRDGRLDVLVANQWSTSSLYVNGAPNPGAFLGLRLWLPYDGSKPFAVGGAVARPVGRPAVGATVTVTRGLTVRRAQVDGGNGHSGKNAPELHFGFGDDRGPYAVDVHWRNAQGQVRTHSIMLGAGWHSVVLGSASPSAVP